MPKRTAATERRKISRPAGTRFRDVVRAYQHDVQTGLGSENPAERYPAHQRRLSGYDVEHLQEFFGQRPAADIRESQVVKYAMRRQAQGAPIVTINEELKTLWHLSRFAATTLGLARRPRIELLRDQEAANRVAAERRIRPSWGAPPLSAKLNSHEAAEETARTAEGRAMVPAGAARAQRRKPIRRGRPPGLTDEELLADVKDHQQQTDGQRARRLSGTLGRPISRDQVRRARERTGVPPFRA